MHPSNSPGSCEKLRASDQSRRRGLDMEAGVDRRTVDLAVFGAGGYTESGAKWLIEMICWSLVDGGVCKGYWGGVQGYTSQIRVQGMQGFGETEVEKLEDVQSVSRWLAR